MSATYHHTTQESLKQTWQDRVDSWSQSGLSKSAFCKSHAVNYHQMIYWSRKLSRATNTKATTLEQRSQPSNGFVAVTVTPQNISNGLSLRLPNGIEIYGVEEQSIARIIQQISKS